MTCIRPTILALLALLTLLTALPLAALAQTDGTPDGKDMAAQWRRMPRDARNAYMAGGAAGLKAFALTQPGTPVPAKIDVAQAAVNMDHLAADPMARRQPMMAVAQTCLLAAQDRGVATTPVSSHIRDPQFDAVLLFDRPWLAPIDLEGFVPTPYPTQTPTFSASWLNAPQHQKLFFIEGFGDMVVWSCLKAYGDTPAGQSCAKPLLPLPPELVAATMDAIYRDPRFKTSGYDLVIRAALRKMTGGDWEAVLAGK